MIFAPPKISKYLFPLLHLSGEDSQAVSGLAQPFSKQFGVLLKIQELKAEKQEAEIKLEATKTALDETLVMLENLENVTTQDLGQEGTTITKEVQEKTKEIVQLKQELQEATLKCNVNEKELKEKVVELDSLKEKIKTGMKLMEKQEDDFKRVTRQLAEVKEKMSNSKTGPGSLNPIDLAEQNAEISQLRDQLKEVEKISRNQDRELLERDGELRSLKEKIVHGMRAMAKQEEELKTSKGRVSELARDKEELVKYAKEGKVHAEQVAHLKEQLTAAEDKLAEVPTTQIQYKYSTNTTQIPHKYNTFTTQIQHKYHTNTTQIRNM